MQYSDGLRSGGVFFESASVGCVQCQQVSPNSGLRPLFYPGEFLRATALVCELFVLATTYILG